MTESRGISRRHLLAGAGALGAAGLVGAVAADAVAQDDASPRRRVDFHGAHQAGIATPVQGHLHFAAFDVTTTDRAALVALLQDWTEAAREMTANRRIGGSAGEPRLAPPSDTGEAVGLDAANLTLTVGFGPSLFDSRFGLGGDSGPRRWPTCRPSPATPWTPRCAVATSPYKPAPTTRR